MVGLVTTIPWFRFQPRVVGSNGCRWLLPSWHLAAIWQLPPMQAELEVRPGSRTEREPISASQHLVDVAQPAVGRKRPMPPGCSMPTTPSWFWHAVHRSPRRRGGRRTDRSAGQERRRAAAVSLLSNNRFASIPGSCVWDDKSSTSVKTVEASLLFDLTEPIKFG